MAMLYSRTKTVDTGKHSVCWYPHGLRHDPPQLYSTTPHVGIQVGGHQLLMTRDEFEDVVRCAYHLMGESS